MYQEFANVYDNLINDVDYVKLSEYIVDLFNSHSSVKENDLVLDLGCGTGSLLLELAQKGYDMIGIDLSIDMLEIAREKVYNEKIDALLINQDMTDFELYGTVKAVVSTMDSFNYILKCDDLKKTFSLIHNYLDDDGIFIFDINTQYKFENIYSKNTFHYVADDVSYIWKCDYDKRKKMCDFDLTFFVWNDEIGAYERFDEQQTERMYKHSEIEKYLLAAGFEIQKVYEEYSKRRPSNKTERAFYICKKVDKINE